MGGLLKVLTFCFCLVVVNCQDAPLVDPLNSQPTESAVPAEPKVAPVEGAPVGTYVYAHYYPEHYYHQFGVIPLDVLHVSPALAAELDFSQLDPVQALPENLREEMENARVDFADYISGLLKDAIYPFMDEWSEDVYQRVLIKGQPRYDTYTRFADAYMGFGLFAARDLKKGEPIGHYSGILRNSNRVWNTDYSWQYNWDAKYHHKNGTGEEILILTDSLTYGNHLRFVNHGDGETQNCILQYAPHGNHWYVLYITLRDIKQHEQLFVSYGSNYWETRPDHNKL